MPNNIFSLEELDIVFIIINIHRNLVPDELNRDLRMKLNKICEKIKILREESESTRQRSEEQPDPRPEPQPGLTPQPQPTPTSQPQSIPTLQSQPNSQPPPIPTPQPQPTPKPQPSPTPKSARIKKRKGTTFASSESGEKEGLLKYYELIKRPSEKLESTRQRSEEHLGPKSTYEPQPGSTPQPQPNPPPQPSPTPQAQSTPQPHSTPQSQPTPTPQPQLTPTPQPQPTPTPQPQPSSTPQPQSTRIASRVPTSNRDDGQPEPTHEPQPSPTSQSQPAHIASRRPTSNRDDENPGPSRQTVMFEEHDFNDMNTDSVRFRDKIRPARIQRRRSTVAHTTSAPGARIASRLPMFNRDDGQPGPSHQNEMVEEQDFNNEDYTNSDGSRDEDTSTRIKKRKGTVSYKAFVSGARGQNEGLLKYFARKKNQGTAAGMGQENQLY